MWTISYEAQTNLVSRHRGTLPVILSCPHDGVEIRHDPGATSPAAPRRTGVLVLYGENGNDYYLRVDNQGRLRISPSDPGPSSQSGTIVGVQT